MAKRKAGNQTGSLTPDRGKSGIDPIPFRAGGMQHVVRKLVMKATTLVQTSSRSEVCTRNYSLTKLQDSQPWRFQGSHLGVPRQKTIWMPFSRSGAKYTIWGKVVVSPESEPWWILWVRGCMWLVLAPSVATPLWPSVGLKPNTSKVGDLESPGTPECLELDRKAQNTLHWAVLGVIGKVLKRR
jgi:hypothetical protein